MSKILNMKLPECGNNYTADDLFNRFGSNDREIQICMKCKNCLIEDGIITCKHAVNIIEGVNFENEN